MRRVLFLLGLWLQLAMIFGLFIPYVILRETGTVAVLRTVPIDPRSIFRGDYVTLGYEVGQNLPEDPELYGQIFVVLKENGEVYERVRYTREKPTLAPGEICLRGEVGWRNATFPDIAQYFVGEGLGHEFESAQNTHRLLVAIAANDDCQASIMGVRIGPETPLEEGSDPFRPERPIPPEAAPVR